MNRSCTLSAAALVLCAGSAALAQTGADNIANAPLIGIGSYAGSTATATPDGTTSCGNSNTTGDVWYRFIPAENQAASTITFATCGSAASFNAVLSIHTGATPAIAKDNSIACNDNACGVHARVTLTNSVAGQTYWIRVSGNSGSTGAYTLAVTGPAAVTVGRGPDIVIYELQDVSNNTSGGAVSGIFAYSVGTTSCNPGDYPAEWISNNNLHPVIAQNMYRLANGRFDQVGQSFVKHGFASVNGTQCGSCVQPPNGGAQLGVNCSDPYGSGLNGNQTGLGPRSQINATTGQFTYTGGFTTTGTAIDRRLQVPASYITGRPAGSRFFVDAQYVTQDDAQFGNGLNNSTFRELNATNITGSASIPFTTFGDANNFRKGKSGLWAWQLADPTVKIMFADYSVTNVKSFPNVPASLMPNNITCRFQVATKVTQNTTPAGTWHYEYVVQNVNSDLSGGSFTIPMPAGANVTNIGFNAPISHSGEPYSNAAWTNARVGNTLVFSTDSFATNPNANAIRWSNAYTFRFDADVAPTTGDVSIGLFKPAAITSVTASGVDVPTVPVAPTCLADIAGGGASGTSPDGTVDGSDFVAFINSFSVGDVAIDAAADVNRDGTIDGADFVAFINAFALGC